MLNKTLLGSAAVIMAVVGAQAADLPSKKAAPATYVKICDAYGAGFFFIPGTDTCLRLGGYVRAEYQYTPATKVYNVNGALATVTNSVTSAATNAITPYQPANLQDTTGFEARGRIDIDARTSTSMGVARTFIRLRGAATSGIRNTTITNALGYTNAAASTTGLSIESAMVQWAGFTFGVGPENYAMMPSFAYHGNPWTGFPNGIKQLSYTATVGGGYSATVGIEDRQDHAYGSTVVDRADTAANLVANIRLDQGWGFAAIHALYGMNSANTVNGIPNTSSSTTMLLPGSQGATVNGYQTYGAYAIGTTVSFKLPMIAAGDQVWFGANYADGMLGALLGTSGMSNYSTAAQHRMLGGLVRVDQNLGVTSATTVANIKGWSVNAAATHYWTSAVRSNFTAGYVEFNPPTSTVTTTPAWGTGKLYVLTGSLVYSPVKDLDIGLELQYANLKNKIQNATPLFVTAGSPGLSDSNWSTKLRVERTF